MKDWIVALAGCLAMTATAGDLADYVDPFVGTAGTGHTFPSACVPFGMVQAGPDTGNEDWAHCSGYVYGDTRIFGFSQTHLNGTALAALLTAGPDAGDLEVSVDGGAFRRVRLRADYGNLHYPYSQVLAEELTDAAHEVRIRLTPAREKRVGTVVRINRLYAN